MPDADEAQRSHPDLWTDFALQRARRGSGAEELPDDPDARLTVRGFIILDYASRYPEAIGALGQWLQQGKLKFRIDMHEGLENAVSTLRKLFTGENQGKLMIHVS